MIHTHETTLFIDVTDAEGHALGRTVPVAVEYVTTIDHDYGADADGHRGTRKVEREVLGVCLAHEDLRTLTSAQVEQVMAEARVQCAQRGAR